MEKSLIRRLLAAAWLFSTVAIIAAQDQLPRPTTEQQKVHAVYHESGYPGLTDSVLESGGSVLRTDAGAPSPDSAISLDAFLLDRTCSADLVVVGTVLAKHPMLTASDRMIFTDYHVKIRAVLRSAEPMTRRTVGLTRPGGSIVTGGRQLGILRIL